MKPLPFRLRQKTDLEKWRVETFWTKEPETIAWIEGFRKGDTFLDIGANIGIYSLYAAKLGAIVAAIEPHPGNHLALTINTRQLNRGLPIRVYWACVGHQEQMVAFKCEEKTAAGSTGGGYTRAGGLDVSVYCYTIDRLMDLCGPFEHIKIDVDGEEKLIVQGMSESLKNRAFRSCLIEVEPQHKPYIITQFEAHGYSRANTFNFMHPHSTDRRRKEGIDVENIVFTRVELRDPADAERANDS